VGQVGADVDKLHAGLRVQWRAADDSGSAAASGLRAIQTRFSAEGSACSLVWNCWNNPMLRRLAVLALAAAGIAPSAQAFEPETGLWWNPAESGRGINIEVQDNTLLITTYVYRPDGTATWFISSGPLNYTYNSAGVLQTVTYNGRLDAAINGQCIGCAYRAPTTLAAAGGPVSINFRTEMQANLTWGGVTTPIERFSPVLGDATTRMLGEWQLVLDFSDRGNTTEWPYRDYPFFADVLLIDLIDRAPNPDLFLGCRPRDSESRCDAIALRDHDVAGSFNSTTREHLIVVKDIPGTFNSAAVFFAYFVNAGLNQFDGVMSIYREGGNPENGPFYPVRGFRSASRTYALTGFGPAAADDGKSASQVSTAGLSTRLLGADGSAPAGMSLAQASTRTGIDIAALAKDLPGVVAGMRTRAAQRAQD